MTPFNRIEYLDSAPTALTFSMRAARGIEKAKEDFRGKGDTNRTYCWKAFLQDAFEKLVHVGMVLFLLQLVSWAISLLTANSKCN